jgi:SPP1 gp7 family putative phage head morphogenesis protein
MLINNRGSIDPSRTTMLRRQWENDLVGRFKIIQQAIAHLIVEQNALGITTNTRWAFQSDAEKLKQFKIWLQIQINQHILSQRQANSWFSDYVAKAYTKGLNRSFEEVRSLGRSQAYYAKKPDFYSGSRAEFLASSFARPVSTNRIELLGSRTYSELKGVTDAMSQHVTRTLVDGMAQGLSPREVAVNLNCDVDGIGIVRARAIARSETIRAHAEGQLDALESLGITHVNVGVEWRTAQDRKVCPTCSRLNGSVLTIQQARGLLPQHPNCRCAWLPASIGSDALQGPKQARQRKASVWGYQSAQPARKLLKRGLGGLKRLHYKPTPLTKPTKAK